MASVRSTGRYDFLCRDILQSPRHLQKQHPAETPYWPSFLEEPGHHSSVTVPVSTSAT